VNIVKTCLTCGREIEPRKKWDKNWAEIKYCSDGCRKNKVRDTYEEQLLAALRALPRDATLDPVDPSTARGPIQIKLVNHLV
jgi:hypothetical protein